MRRHCRCSKLICSVSLVRLPRTRTRNDDVSASLGKGSTLSYSTSWFLGGDVATKKLGVGPWTGKLVVAACFV